jgi:putative PIG3 family NAD(P)H quinone oxidoreductase
VFVRAIIMEQFGGPEVLKIGAVETPEPRDGQVLVKVEATTVNRADTSQRLGHYPAPKGESELLGLEVAGTIASIGSGITEFAVGDRVMSLVGGGGYAEYALAYADHLIRIPDSMSYEQAACVCETYITAYLNVFMLGKLEDGETVLLHGGGGGVNTSAIQLCRHLTPASRIIVTASPGKIARVAELGAHDVIDYRARDFAEAVRELTDKHGVDVILDHIGGKYLTQNLASLAVGGRLVIIGLMGGAKAEINLGLVMVKRQQVIGSVLRSRPVAEKASIARQFTAAVMPLFEHGTIEPLIHAVLPLDQAAEGHRMMEASEHFGKIVLKP